MTIFSTLNTAWSLMLEDQGIGADTPFPALTDYADIKLERVDAALAKLSPEELETLCVGDQDEWAPVIAKHFSDAEWPEIHAVLDELFMESGE